MAGIDDLIRLLGIAQANQGPPPPIPATAAMPPMPATGVIGMNGQAPVPGLIERMLGTQLTSPNVPVAPGAGNGPGLPVPIQSAPPEIAPNVLQRLGELFAQPQGPQAQGTLPVPAQPRRAPEPPPVTTIPLPPPPLPPQGQTILPGIAGGQGVPLPQGGATIIPGMLPPGADPTPIPRSFGETGVPLPQTGALPPGNNPNLAGVLGTLLGLPGGEAGSPPFSGELPAVPSASPPQTPAGTTAGPATGPGVSPPSAPGAAPQTGGQRQGANSPQGGRESSVVESPMGTARFKDVLGVIGAILAQPIPAGGNEMSQIGKALAAGFLYNQGVEQNNQQQAQEKAKTDIAARRVAVDEAGLPLAAQDVATRARQQQTTAALAQANIQRIMSDISLVPDQAERLRLENELARAKLLADPDQRAAALDHVKAQTEDLRTRAGLAERVVGTREQQAAEKEQKDLDAVIAKSIDPSTNNTDWRLVDTHLATRPGWKTPDANDNAKAQAAFARARAAGISPSDAIQAINAQLLAQRTRPVFRTVPK